MAWKISIPADKKFKPSFDKKYPPKPAIQAAGEEMKSNPPAILAKTRKKKGKVASRKQAVAIMLSKARRGQ